MNHLVPPDRGHDALCTLGCLFEDELPPAQRQPGVYQEMHDPQNQAGHQPNAMPSKTA